MPAVDIDGLRIHCREGSVRNPDGRRVLYVHGTGCNGRVWQRHLEAIGDQHHAIAIDLPGHGQSDGDGFRGAADYAHFVASLADRLGWDRWVVAGHSLGGAVALTVAVYYPEKLSGLMLIDTGARLRVSPEILKRAQSAAAGDRTSVSDGPSSYAPTTPQSVIDGMAELIGEIDPRVTLKDWIADDSFDFMSRVHQVEVPSIAICGEQDPLTPVRNHRYFRDQMPNCSLEVIADAGHWPYVEQPEAFDRAVRRFLSSIA